MYYRCRIGKRLQGKSQARLLLLSLLIAAAALAACSSTKSSASATRSKHIPTKLQPVTIGTFTAGAPQVEIQIMETEGIFAKYGLKPVIISATSGPSLVAGQLSGSIDIGSGQIGLILPALIQGHDFKFVSPVAMPNFYNVIAQPSIPVKPAGIGLTPNAKANIRAMRGATVGVAAVGGLNYLTMAALAKASGLGPTEFTQVASGGPATLVAGFKTHRFQYLVTDHPVFTLLKEAGVPFHTVAMVNTSTKNDWGHMVSNDWMATSAFVRSHTSVAMKFCRAMLAATSYIGNPKHKAQVIAAGEKVEGISPAEGAMWYRNNRFLYSPGIPMTKPVWDAQREWLVASPYANSPFPHYSTINYKPCSALGRAT